MSVNMRGNQVVKMLMLEDTEISSVKNPVSVFLMKPRSLLLKGFLRLFLLHISI